MARKSMSDSFAIRGLMLDPARLTERHEFYFDLLGQLAAWGYNTLWWHFCDDEGFALKLDSMPELASPYALSKAETRRLVRAAREVGITVVPEVESLGHGLAITSLPKYAHLFDGNPRGHNAICPSHPDTLKIMARIIPEVAELFDGPYLHAGLDEAELGDCRRCRRRAAGKPRWWIFAQHAKAIHKIVRSCRRQMIIWADPVEKNPALLRQLPKDIVLAHWHYRKVPAERIVPSVNAGFQIICVPAISGMVLQPDARAFQNVDDHVALAGHLRRRGCLGVVACWWESARNLRDTYPLAAAYTGRAIRTGKASHRLVFCRRFLRDYFALTDAAAAEALWRLHELVPGRLEIKMLMPDTPAHIHEALGLAAAENFDERAQQAQAAVAALRAARSKVKAHKAEYDASVLAGRITAGCYRNGQLLRQAYQLYAKAAAYADGKAPRHEVLALLGQATEALAQMQGPIDDVATAASREWDRTRYSRDAKKDGSSPRVRQRGPRAVLPTLLRCRRYHRELLRRFRQAVAAYRRGGPFPTGV